MQNILDPDQKVKFQGFQLVVEASGTRWNQGNGMSVNGGGGVGTFHLQPGDSMTKFMHRCPNAIEAASSIPKEKIEVRGRSGLSDIHHNACTPLRYIGWPRRAARAASTSGRWWRSGRTCGSRTTGRSGAG